MNLPESDPLCKANPRECRKESSVVYQTPDRDCRACTKEKERKAKAAEKARVMRFFGRGGILRGNLLRCLESFFLGVNNLEFWWR
jgi:hypothetical protein